MTEASLRRVAANVIILPDGTRLRNHVVELLAGRLVNVYPLEGELPLTEWLGGTIQFDPLPPHTPHHSGGVSLS